MNSLLVAWRPLLLITVLVVGGLWMSGHNGLAAFAGAGLFLLMIMLLTGNLAMSGLVATIVAIVIVLNFTGHLNYNRNRAICQEGYHWNGPWQVVWAVGRLEFRMRPYYCPPEQRFDPREYHRL